MVRKRLITVLTFNNGILFRTKEFNPDYRYTLNFVDAWSVDEIVVLDITRPGEGNRNNFYEVVSSFAKKCFVPLAAGGGVRSIEDFQTLLRIGADKVVVNTGAVERPELIREAAKLYGAQCVVVSIDSKKTTDFTSHRRVLPAGSPLSCDTIGLKGQTGCHPPEQGRKSIVSQYEVFTQFGTKPTGMSPELWAQKAEELGAGEIMITSIEKDGSLEGYDNELNRRVAKAVTIPVLVSGGAGKWQDFVDGFNEGKGSAVCTTCIYHFTEPSIMSAKKFLKDAGINIRM